MLRFNKINWYGMYSLSLREVLRFLRVYHQTIVGPMVSSILFLVIFLFATNGEGKEIEFIGYGVIIMSMIQNAFANSSSSLNMFKVVGYIVDILTAPLGGGEVVVAFIIGSVVRALFVGCVVALALSGFINYQIFNVGYLLIFTFLGTIFLSQLGIFSALASTSFEQNTAFNNYIIMPLSFLSGTFYSVKKLNIFFQKINLINPFFYIIDGFRYSFTNNHDSNILFGVLYLTILNFSLFFLLKFLFSTGWRIKQ